MSNFHFYYNFFTFESFCEARNCTKLWMIGVIHKPCGQDFGHFWLPTYPTWTKMDISLTAYLCPRGHSWNHPLSSKSVLLTKFELQLDRPNRVNFIVLGWLCKHLLLTGLIFRISFSDKWKLELVICLSSWFFHFCFLPFSAILSTWTFRRPPTYLAWTIVDIWLTTQIPYLVHVVCEWPRMFSKKWYIFYAVCKFTMHS